MNIKNLIQTNIAQWGKFIMNLISLIIAGIVYSFLIINFFIKSYIPGDVLYPDNACKEPYVTLKESKNPFDKINPFEEMDAIESQLYSSRYQFCPKNIGEDVLNKYKDDNWEIELFLINAKQSSKMNIDFMFFDMFRSYNKLRAGKINYHGFLQEAIMLMLVSYFKTSVTIKKFFKRMHNILSVSDIAQPYLFGLILFLNLVGYLYLNLTQDTGKSFPSMLIAISIQMLYILLSIMFFFFFVIGFGMIGVSGFINLIYAILELPGVTITGIGGVFIGLVVFAFSFFHAASVTLQLFKLFALDTFLNVRNRNRIIGFLQKPEYINWLILTFAILSFILAGINLSTSNAIIWSLTLFVYAMYKFFGGTNDTQNNDTKKDDTNDVQKFIDSLKDLQLKGSEKNAKNTDEDNKKD